MKTVNSLSGGKSSSYIALNYKADFNVFSLVRTNDKLCQYPDKKVRQIVSDLIGCEFVGTTEQDNIIEIMLNLSEQIDIDWISGKPFEDVINIETPSSLNSTTHNRYAILERKAHKVTDFNSLKELLTDHEEYPKSICSHFETSAQDPSYTCGGGIMDFNSGELVMWRGCPVHDDNFKEFTYKF